MTINDFITPPALTLRLNGAEHRAVLRMPTVGQTHVFVSDPSLHRGPEAQEVADRLQILDSIETLDGETLTMHLARLIVAEPPARDGVLQARAQWLAVWREGGTAYALCPHCRRGESEWSLSALAALQGVPRRPLADATGRLLPFCLSWPPVIASRPPGVALAARLRFRLPSATAIAGVLENVDPLAEALAWQRFAPIGEDPSEEHDDWTFETAGFRAVLRACVALEQLNGTPRSQLTPADIEPWPIGDFCFLDELYSLAFNTSALAALPARCGTCGQPFLPLPGASVRGFAGI